MINFQVESSLNYEMALQKYQGTEYIPRLLQNVKKVIQQYGISIDFPNELSQNMTSQELDYFLLLIEKSTDSLIYEHIYVKLPSKHATSLLNLCDETIWRANGIGLDSILLVGIDEDAKLTVQLPTIQELQNNYIIYTDKNELSRF